jgi:hypothetical protein
VKILSIGSQKSINTTCLPESFKVFPVWSRRGEGGQLPYQEPTNLNTGLGGPINWPGNKIHNGDEDNEAENKHD